MSGNRNTELRTKLALRESQQHKEEARGVEVSSVDDERKQIALLRRKLATEVDRRDSDRGAQGGHWQAGGGGEAEEQQGDAAAAERGDGGAGGG